MITKEELRVVLKEIPAASFKGKAVATPWGMMFEPNDSFVDAQIASLVQKYPGFDFRLIMCHDKTHTYLAITVDNPDPREWNEMAKHGSWDDEGYYTLHKDTNK